MSSVFVEKLNDYNLTEIYKTFLLKDKKKRAYIPYSL